MNFPCDDFHSTRREALENEIYRGPGPTIPLVNVISETLQTDLSIGQPAEDCEGEKARHVHSFK